MRHGCGNRDNPTAQELLAEYRKVTVDSLFTHVTESNRDLDAGEFIAKLNFILFITKYYINDIVYKVNIYIV